MEKKLGSEQLKAWEAFITRQSLVLGQIEKALENEPKALPLHLYDVLLVLRHAPQGKMRLSDIADRIVTSRSALTRSVEKLEKMEFLTKEKAKEDGRGLYAEITTTGKAAQKETWLLYREAIQSFFGKYLTVADAKQVTEILLKIPNHRIKAEQGNID